MKSKVLIHIVKENEIQGKTLISEEYITDIFVYTKTPKINLLFRKDTKKLYKVDRAKNSLIEIPKNEQQLKQLNQLKAMITTLDIKAVNSFDEKTEYIVDAKGNGISLNAEIITRKIDGIKDTVNHEMYRLSQETALFNFDLSDNEIIEKSNIFLNIQSNQSSLKSEITEINIVKESIGRYDYLYAYPISEN